MTQEMMGCLAVALAGPHANHLHLAADRYHASTLSLNFYSRMLFLTPNQQCQTTKGKISNCSCLYFACKLMTRLLTSRHT